MRARGCGFHHALSLQLHIGTCAKEIKMRMRTPTRRSRSGFTLIELLVVLLILAILMGISLPLYLRAVADSQLKTCRSNMHTIANAVQSARVKAQLTDYTTLAGAPSTTREPDLAYVPLCPNGGTYSVVV